MSTLSAKDARLGDPDGVWTPPPPEEPPFEDLLEQPAVKAGDPPMPEPPSDLFTFIEHSGAAIVDVPGTPTPQPAHQNGNGDRPPLDYPRTKLNAVLHRVTQYNPDGTPAETHWVGIEQITVGDPASAISDFEKLLARCEKSKWVVTPAARIPAAPVQPLTPTNPAPPAAVNPPVAPARSSTVPPNAPSTPQQPTGPSAGGSTNSGSDKLHRIDVDPDGNVLFYVVGFKWPFKDTRYKSSNPKAANLHAGVFGKGGTNIQLVHLQTPGRIDLEQFNIVADWEKPDKYYNVIGVRVAQ